MSEEVKNGKVVGISYTLRDKEGNVLDQSGEGQPLEYLHGEHNIIPGLEKELNGMKVGESKKVVVPADEAYGEYDEELLFQVPKENFPKEVELKEGMEFQTNSDEGQLVIRVLEVHPEFVVVDGNHPLAGEELTFDVKVENIREATAQERAHGHVHHHGHDH